MKNFEDKTKKILRSINDFFKINPHKHWEFLLYIFFVMVVLLILWSLYLLYEIKNEQIFQVEYKNSTDGVLLNESLLKSTQKNFIEKTKKAETNVIYSDPS